MGAPAWGGARASASKKRSAGLGTAAWGSVDGSSGVGQCTGVGVEEEERGAGNGGTGAVDGCAGNGGARRRGVVLRRHGGRGWRGVEMNLDNFNPHRAFIPELITAGSNYKPTVMGYITAGCKSKPTVMEVHHCQL